MLIVDDPEIERLIERLSAMRGLNRNEVLSEALRNELKRYENASDLIETGVAFVRALHARVQRDVDRSDDRSFVEGLYDER